MNRLGIINRIMRLGLRSPAEALREEVRLRHRAAGKDKAEALTLAWAAMWEEFRPTVERLEGQANGAGRQLLGTTDDLDTLLNPAYHEPDAGRRLRDGLVWAAEEIRRIVSDAPDGETVIDLARASVPPPTAWAVFVVEHYAMKAAKDRGELIARVMPLAAKQHDAQPGGAGPVGEGGFLDDLGE
jgi:hypothetical protein